LDWKDRLVRDSVDFFERKLPEGDYDFDIIYNAYPERQENKMPKDVIVLVANTLASKMLKKHKEYVAFCDYIWNKKGINGKIAFACIISKFMRKDHRFYFDYAKKHLFSTTEVAEINILMDKIFFPIFKKYPLENIDTLISWLREGNEKINQQFLKVVFKIGKNEPEFLKKFSSRLENRWLNASPEFIKISGAFLKNLSKVDDELYLDFYRNYKSTREPIFVEILTIGLVKYEDFIYEIYENWGKSGNARLKKAAITGLKFLKKRK